MIDRRSPRQFLVPSKAATLAGFAGRRREFFFGAVRGVLLINDLGDFEQQLARSVGGGCVNMTIIHCGFNDDPAGSSSSFRY